MDQVVAVGPHLCCLVSYCILSPQPCVLRVPDSLFRRAELSSAPFQGLKTIGNPRQLQSPDTWGPQKLGYNHTITQIQLKNRKPSLGDGEGCAVTWSAEVRRAGKLFCC